MALTPSQMIPLGTKAPTFSLPDAVSGKIFSLEDLKSNKPIVIMFICNHCPYVKHIQFKLKEVAENYQAKGVQFIAINSNDIENYPEDAPDKMRQTALELNYTFPYLFDESQQIAKDYQAACTPDFYLFDQDRLCVYRGRFDSSTPKNNQPVTGAELTTAIDQLLNNQPISQHQQPSIGCNIKWKDTF